MKKERIKVSVTFYMSQEESEKIKRLSQTAGLTFSYVLEQAIRQCLQECTQRSWLKASELARMLEKGLIKDSE